MGELFPPPVLVSIQACGEVVPITICFLLQVTQKLLLLKGLNSSFPDLLLVVVLLWVWSGVAIDFKKPFLQFKGASVIGIPLQTYILLQVEHFQFEDIIWEYLGGRLTSKCPIMLRIISV